MVSSPIDDKTATLCQHLNQELTIDGEMVCKQCGVIQGHEAAHYYYDSRAIDGISANCRNYNNLYLAKSLGSKECKDRKQSDDSMFSNACNKLELPIYISNDAWKRYLKLGQVLDGRRIKKAERAAYAIRETVRKYDLPLPDDEITEAARSSFTAKEIRKMTRIVLKIKTRIDDSNVDVSEGPTVAQDDKYHVNAALWGLLRNPTFYGVSMKTDVSNAKQIALSFYRIMEGCRGVDVENGSSQTTRTKLEKSIKLAKEWITGRWGAAA